MIFTRMRFVLICTYCFVYNKDHDVFCFLKFQQEHDYIVPLKDESSFSDSDDDTMDDTDNVEVKHESTDDHILVIYDFI